MKRLLPLVLAIASASAAEPLVLELPRSGEPLRIAVDGREFEVAKGGSRITTMVAEGTPVDLAKTARGLAEKRPGAGISVVGHRLGSDGQAGSRVVITHHVAVRVPDGEDVDVFCAREGLRLVRRFDYAPGFVLAEPVDADPLAAVHAELHLRRAGLWAEAQIRLPIKAYAVPSDPLYATQWHLTAGVGIGIDIAAHWAGAGPYYTGLGQNVAVVDTGMDLTHEDLAAGARTDIDVDVFDNDLDPSHGAPADDDGHGTVVAGLIGARANNGKGVAGVAYNVGLVGVRLLGPGSLAATAETADALAHRATATSDVIAVSNNSWGPVLNGTGLGGIGALVDAALHTGTTSGRNGRGTVYVFAAGNGFPNDTTDFNAFTSDRRVIAVAATTNTGTSASYSERGVATLISAPGGGSDITAMVSTDWTDFGGRRGFQTGSYTEQVTPTETPAADAAKGTSFAAALVAGTAAILIERQPKLSWRDVPWILALSAQSKTGANHLTNRAGLGFDLDYGSGLLDVSNALILAGGWTPLPPELSYTAAATATTDPFDETTAAGKTFSFDSVDMAGFVVERVVVTVHLTHPWRGDVDLTLRAPDRLGPVNGTSVPILGRTLDSRADLVDWPFTSVWTMGESGGGTWTLSAIDAFAHTGTRTLDACTLTLYGYKPYSVPVITNTFPSAMVETQTNIIIAVDATGQAVSQGGDLLGSLQADAVGAAPVRDVVGWPSATYDLSAKNAGDTVSVALVNPTVRQANTLALGGGGSSNVVVLPVRPAAGIGENQVPVAGAVIAGSVIAGFPTTSGAAVFSDPDGDTMRYRISAGPAGGSATIDPVTGVVTYTPLVTLVGFDSITVEATDGMAPSTSVIAYTVERNLSAGLDINTSGGTAGGGGGCGAGGGTLGLIGLLAFLGLRRRRR